MTSSHNAFLEDDSELGVVGIGLLAAIIVSAIWRSVRCCQSGAVLLGWFSFAFIAVAIFAGQTSETLGLNQNIAWLVFTIMFFSCGQRLWSFARAHKRSAMRPNFLNNSLRGPGP